MSKKCQKESRQLQNKLETTREPIYPQFNENAALDIVLGSSNVNRWMELKTIFCCKSNSEFATVLLNLAEEHGERKEKDLNQRHTSVALLEEGDDRKQMPAVQKRTTCKNKIKKAVTKKGKNETNLKDDNANRLSDTLKIHNTQNAETCTKSSLCMTDIKTELPEHSRINNNNSTLIENTSIIASVNLSPASILKAALKKSNTSYQLLNKKTSVSSASKVKHPEIVIQKTVKISSNSEKMRKQIRSAESAKAQKLKKKVEHDIRKAPELDLQADTALQLETHLKESFEDDKQRVAIKIKLCLVCSMHHLQDICPLQNPKYVMLDSLTHSEWSQQYKQLFNEKSITESNINHDSASEDKIEPVSKFSFSCMSMPSCLFSKDSNTNHGLSIYAQSEIKEYTQFGPLVGKIVKEVDIPEDFNMKNLWEVYGDNNHTFINTKNVEDSNWLKFVRPAPSREERNLAVVCKDGDLHMTTVRTVHPGEELLYWQDNIITTNKKKMEKTTCGGCNMTFAHPLYYRTHCSVFHDIRYSLTIRKYHCKVCGIAVLGKENIMRHAAELHNGQGAYQCQFCKKFFLRLNYLEMHRTYGCSANPHRSRPLCDFCGRKFCQPQKLKVHIKRMHSDMSEVLKEFQCKNCLKILGSRAALQRHLKEVHNKQVEGACACSKCGKMFQNKSNLKIHMLTHSGIKPFRCAEPNCNAAFTTKQCLQFHYKKVHGFAEDAMPKIERSVDYTFEAYSGVEDGEQDSKFNVNLSEMNFQNSNIDNMDDSSDIDDASLDDRNVDEPPRLHSPIPITNSHSSVSNPSPPTLEPYNCTSLDLNTKVLSKGSKKWIGDDSLSLVKHDMYQCDPNQSVRTEETSNSIDVDEPHVYEPTKLQPTFNTFNRHESNASLLVEAALDSVCSKSNLDMDVTTVPSGADALVNNLYTLAHPDSLSDVTYNHSINMNEPRDISLISPTVKDHISVADDLNDELSHNQNLSGVDYTTFHHEDFSPDNSPSLHQRNSFVRDYINTVSPQAMQSYETNRSKNVSPVSSPHRYDFEQNVNVDHNLSSEDSNGIGVQNLSLHNNKNDVQLDLSIYKTPYLRMKFDLENERKQVYVLEVSEVAKNGKDENTVPENVEQNDLTEDKEFDVVHGEEGKDKESSEERYKYASEQSVDTRNKFELDLDLRIKTYENIENEMRNRNYEGNFDVGDFRIKNYELDSLDARLKSYEGFETDFRSDRNLDPLVLNPTDMQGLDMSARGYHNYTNINRYHHLYSEVDRPSVDLRLNYSPPQPSYTHADILRVVSLDLTPPGRHSVDLSLRTHSLHQIANSRLLSEHALQSNTHRLLDQSRLLNPDLNTGRHLMSETGSRILSDHTTNRLLSNDQILPNRLISSEQNRLLAEESRLIAEQPRLLDQNRLIGESRILPPAVSSGPVSPVQYSSYSVSPSPYHPTPLTPRSHVTSPNPTSYHHYSAYY